MTFRSSTQLTLHPQRQSQTWLFEAGIPLVYINREPDASEEQRWADNNWDVTYVGCDARQSGTYQGEMIADLGLDTVDMNGNGKIDYINDRR